MSSSNTPGFKAVFEKVLIAILIFAALAVCIGFVVFTCTRITTRPSIEIMSVWMAPIDISPNVSQIAANWTIKFEVKNHSKRDINYRDIQVSVLYYSDESLSSVKLSPFVQHRKNQTTLVAMPTAVLRNSRGDQTGSAISRDAKETGIVSFDVDFRLQYEYGNKIRRGSSTNKRLGYVHFVCDGVEVRFPPGSMRERSKRCPYNKDKK